MSARTIDPNRIERLLAGVLNFGTWLASAVIAVGLALSLFPVHAQLPAGSQVVTVGVVLFILLPVLRVILMMVLFLKEREYQFATAAAVVFVIISAGFALGTLSKFK